MTKTIWTLNQIHKSFHGNPVLSGIDLELFSGEIHGLFGCNGAGKSTLVNILSGYLRPDSGELLINGKSAVFSSPRDAVQKGISVSTQELMLFDNLSITDNLFLTKYSAEKRSFIHYENLHQKTQKILEQFHIVASPEQRAGTLSQSERYLLQFARCYLSRPQLLILDEITSCLTPAESRLVFSVIQELKANGTAILYITHKVQDLLAISDRVTVFRDGHAIISQKTGTLTPSSLHACIFGDALQKKYPKLPAHPRQEILRADHISNPYLKNVSLSLHRGEIVGILGIAGSGRSRLLRALAGIDAIASGQIFYEKKPVVSRHRLLSSIAYMPEDRDSMALFGNWGCAQNITIKNLQKISSHRILRLQEESILSKNMSQRLGIKSLIPGQNIRHLSSGNKQKLLVGRSLHSHCGLYLFDEPTQGIDIAGKVDVYNIMTELAQKGAAILMVSSDYSELTGMCDRILVMQKGKIILEASPEEIRNSKFMDAIIE